MDYIRRIFKNEFTELEEKRQECASRPLTSEEISILLNMRCDGIPLHSPGSFYRESS